MEPELDVSVLPSISEELADADRPEVHDNAALVDHFSPGDDTCSRQKAELLEAYRALEQLEHALVEERQRSGVLRDQNKMIEASHRRDVQMLETMLDESAQSHKRDVQMLESMLEEALAENKKLSDQVSAWELTKLPQVVETFSPVAKISEEAPEFLNLRSDSPRLSCHSDTEPEMEPRWSSGVRAV